MFRKMLAGAAALALLSSSALAAQDWGFISTVGDPDPVTYFDLADPAGSQTPAGFVDGNFNRGMEFFSPDEFYYVVTTDALNDPDDRGLWVWKENTNTQLFVNPFSDSSDGDIALSGDGDTLFWLLDDGSPTDTLYKYEGLISGNISLTRIGETGVTGGRGLAMQAGTGKLFMIDSSTDELYTVSTTDGSSASIGALGVNVGSIGSMDFGGDGTLVHSDGGELYSIDLTSGAATALGDLGTNAAALSFRVPEPATGALLALTLLFVRRR